MFKLLLVALLVAYTALFICLAIIYRKSTKKRGRKWNVKKGGDMILSYKEDFLMNAIKDGTKKTTIREDKHKRWRAGRTIQHWRGNPRNKGSYPFGVGQCVSVNRIGILPNMNIVVIGEGRDQEVFSTPGELNRLAKNDGFRDWSHMKTWFDQPFRGRLIAFTYKAL